MTNPHARSAARSTGTETEAEAMNTNHLKQIVLGTTLVAAVSAGIAVAPASSGSTPAPAPMQTGSRATHHSTPNDCIRRNGGDWNACNVGNSGQGDPPFQITRPRTPNECILVNLGDFNACNVGNNGRGDLPYKPVK
jgi:hypothetical protein